MNYGFFCGKRQPNEIYWSRVRRGEQSKVSTPTEVKTLRVADITSDWAIQRTIERSGFVIV